MLKASETSETSETVIPDISDHVGNVGKPFRVPTSPTLKSAAGKT
jgi:hypothetical protein